MNGTNLLDKNQTGKNIHANMVANEMTYDALADKLGFTSSRVIYDWVAGLKCPSIDSLLKLSELFQVPLEAILSKKASL